MALYPTLAVSVPGADYHRQLIACQVACPVHTDARGYIRAIAEGRYEEAYLIARGPNPLASICGRICGAPCEAACRRGRVPRVDADGHFVAEDRPIAIRALKRFACESGGWERRDPADYWKFLRQATPPIAMDAEELAAWIKAEAAGRVEKAAGQPVAIVGGGPAGLAAAHDLALMGFRPVIFEAERVPGGMLALGVPAYRLPRELIRWEISVIEALGAELRCGQSIGEHVSFAHLRREYAAVILAVGAKRARRLGIPGENGPGVYGGVDLLRAVALGEPFQIGRHVVVIGGGNVAYDVARTVLRQVAWDTARTAARMEPGTGVKLVSLETLEEMPADTQEILEGDEEGIERLGGWGPLEIERGANGEVTAVVFRRCLRVYDENRRFAPLFDDNDRIRIPCDTVLLAVGQTTSLDFLAEGGEDIKQHRPGWPVVDPETLATTAPGVFVAGDLAHGTKLLIDAVASGKRAARSVYEYLTGRRLVPEATTVFLEEKRYRRERGYEGVRRQPIPTTPVTERLKGWDVLVETGYDATLARREASRCLDCAVSPVFDGSRCILCGGCADVCPTRCLKLVPLQAMERNEELEKLVAALLGEGIDWTQQSAILKDEDRCIRCGLCAARCPADAITMERVCHQVEWKTL